MGRRRLLAARSLLTQRNRMWIGGYSSSFHTCFHEPGAIPMRMKRLVAGAAPIAAGTAFAHDTGGDRFERNVLFKFDGGTGVQPFRSQAGAPVLNTVAGVS